MLRGKVNKSSRPGPKERSSGKREAVKELILNANKESVLSGWVNCAAKRK